MIYTRKFDRFAGALNGWGFWERERMKPFDDSCCCRFESEPPEPIQPTFLPMQGSKKKKKLVFTVSFASSNVYCDRSYYNDDDYCQSYNN
jgi:hypothetical protein